MSLYDSKKKYGLVTDFSWKIIGAFSLILLSTYIWSYLTNDLNKNISILKENKYIVSSALNEFKRIDRESISWMKSFNIDDQVKYEEDISNLNDKFIEISNKDLGGLDILIALNKHKEYWDILTNQILQINLLSVESNNSFYKFNDFVLSNTKSSEIINKIILLPELHRQITDMKSSIVMSVIERDIALIVRSIPLSEDYAKKYLVI
jgi:hypothetical protein